jgi:cell division septation protein DedD
MKSEHYIAILVAVAVIAGGVIVFSAKRVSNVSDDVANMPVKTAPQQNNTTEAPAVQKDINVMKDTDVEYDVEDLSVEEDVDVQDVENIMADETVSF